jgi:hypothetical protein
VQPATPSPRNTGISESDRSNPAGFFSLVRQSTGGIEESVPQNLTVRDQPDTDRLLAQILRLNFLPFSHLE